MKNSSFTIVRQQKSIKEDIFASSIFLSSTIIIVFSFFLSLILYQNSISNAYQVLKQRNLAVKNFIEGYFTKIKVEVNLLSSIDKISEAPFLTEKERKHILKLYKAVQAADRDINYVYSGYKNGLLLINNYIPPKGFNPVVRPWYRAALKAAPNATDGIPYREIKTKKWLVSISRALFNKKGEITGVISIDCSVNRIVNLLKETFGGYKHAFSFVIKRDGTIIIHSRKELLNKNFFKLINLKEKLTKKQGKFSYKYHNTGKLAYYSVSDKVGWIVITVVNKNEIFKPIIEKILLSVLIIIIFSLIIARYLSTSLTKRILLPLTNLEKRVNSIMTGDSSKLENYKYPKNEIGRIASNVEKLTENELYNKNIKLNAINTQLHILSTTDHLTGLYNRRKINKELKKEFKRSARYGSTFSLILIDIDFFKKINDTLGHQSGDAALKELGELLKKNIRETDIAARWGGEEFLVLCPNTDLEEAKNLAERLRIAVESHKFSINRKITISLGVIQFENQSSISEMLKQVDQKLYQAKNEGRNRVSY